LSFYKAVFVGDVPAGVSLEFHQSPLKGVREEFRNLRIILTKQPGRSPSLLEHTTTPISVAVTAFIS
jgi:hypothetical protein